VTIGFDMPCAQRPQAIPLARGKYNCFLVSKDSGGARVLAGESDFRRDQGEKNETRVSIGAYKWRIQVSVG
jgi:hypothetical protein